MDLSLLFGVRWIHVFEEDAPGRQVYRPERADVPLSRRPRERLVIEPDGVAVWHRGAPDDRLTALRGRWQEAGGEVRFLFPEGAGAPARVREFAASRLVLDS